MAPLTLMPGIFNINEPTLFGLPVVLNVRLIVPFILAPMINATITYFAMASGLVHLTNGNAMPWTIPPIISGFLATGHVSGSLYKWFVSLLISYCIIHFTERWKNIICN